MTLRVVLAEDHAVVREGLRLLIDAEPDMIVVGQAETGPEAVRVATALQPDVVVMDVSLPLLDGADAAAQIVPACPGVSVLALTRHANRAYLRRMLQAGATGYVVKKAAGDQLINAIRSVAGGSLYIDPRLSEDLVAAVVGGPYQGESAAAHSELTEREAQVLRLIAWGLSNKEIAARLGVSVKTVEYHKTTASHKLALRGRTDIVRYALARGWLSDDQAPE
jgi:two-component system, NarL family, response regulator NreC